MPLTYRIDTDEGVIYTHATGVLTADEMLVHKQRLADDPQRQHGFVELSDVRGATELQFDLSALADFAGADKATSDSRGDGHRLALVVSDERIFEMARGYQLVSAPTGMDVAVFRDIAPARAWLGLEPV